MGILQNKKMHPLLFLNYRKQTRLRFSIANSIWYEFNKI